MASRSWTAQRRQSCEANSGEPTGLVVNVPVALRRAVSVSLSESSATIVASRYRVVYPLGDICDELHDTCAIWSLCRILADTRPEGFCQRLHAVAVDRVVLHAASRLDLDQSRPLQLREVPGHGRLGDPQPADDLLGIELAAAEQVDDAQPVGIAKGPQHFEQVVPGAARWSRRWRDPADSVESASGASTRLPDQLAEHVLGAEEDHQVRRVADVTDERANVGRRAEGDAGHLVQAGGQRRRQAGCRSVRQRPSQIRGWTRPGRCARPLPVPRAVVRIPPGTRSPKSPNQPYGALFQQIPDVGSALPPLPTSAVVRPGST